MTRVGIVGVGFMGMVHYLTYQKLKGIEVVALCEQNPKRLAGDWTDIKGNFGPPGEQMDLSGLATYESAEELIGDSNVDLVDITLPPAAHADVAVAALQAGKHVFCEKPMAMNVADCDRMQRAAKEAERHLMIGHVLSFFPEYAWALREIRSGEHGQLLGGSFKRLISDPAWLTNYWDAEAVGGPMLDLHIHDAQFIRLAFGMPSGVSTRGTVRNGLPEHWHSLFEFPEKQCFAHATCGALPQAGRAFSHGFEIRLERATLMFDFEVLNLAEGGEQAGYTCPPTILDSSGQAKRVGLGDGDPMLAFQAELEQVSKVIAGSAEPDALDCALARDAIEICQMQSKSLASCS
jgi:predicted dehydrogenase